jgi:hypothetical protein
MAQDQNNDNAQSKLPLGVSSVVGISSSLLFRSGFYWFHRNAPTLGAPRRLPPNVDRLSAVIGLAVGGAYLAGVSALHFFSSSVEQQSISSASSGESKTFSESSQRLTY